MKHFIRAVLALTFAKSRTFKRVSLALTALLVLASGLQWMLSYNGIVSPIRLPAPLPQPRLMRPYGMAPAAFDALLRACVRAHIQPHRIGQTIGDNPLSVGYHKRDGALKVRGQKLDYTAAVDLGCTDLTPAQTDRFMEELARQGFAAFHRYQGKWKWHEHIHAIYAPLPMKPQLRGQVRQWAAQRQREHRQTYAWQRRLHFD